MSSLLPKSSSSWPWAVAGATASALWFLYLSPSQARQARKMAKELLKGHQELLLKAGFHIRSDEYQLFTFTLQEASEIKFTVDIKPGTRSVDVFFLSHDHKEQLSTGTNPAVLKEDSLSRMAATAAVGTGFLEAGRWWVLIQVSSGYDGRGSMTGFTTSQGLVTVSRVPLVMDSTVPAFRNLFVKQITSPRTLLQDAFVLDAGDKRMFGLTLKHPTEVTLVLRVDGPASGAAYYLPPASTAASASSSSSSPVETIREPEDSSQTPNITIQSSGEAQGQQQQHPASPVGPAPPHSFLLDQPSEYSSPLPIPAPNSPMLSPPPSNDDSLSPHSDRSLSPSPTPSGVGAVRTRGRRRRSPVSQLLIPMRYDSDRAVPDNGHQAEPGPVDWPSFPVDVYLLDDRQQEAFSAASDGMLSALGASLFGTRPEFEYDETHGLSHEGITGYFSRSAALPVGRWWVVIWSRATKSFIPFRSLPGVQLLLQIKAHTLTG